MRVVCTGSGVCVHEVIFAGRFVRVVSTRSNFFFGVRGVGEGKGGKERSGGGGKKVDGEVRGCSE